MTSSSQRRIFRKAALDRLSSPEQLDLLVTVTDSFGWLALSTLLILLALVTGWGFLGSIPDDIEARGILVSRGGQVVDAMSPANGRIERLTVKVGAYVEAGQEIAIIEQTALEESLRSSIAMLDDKSRELLATEENYELEKSLYQKNSKEQIASQRQIVSAASDRADYLKETLARQEELSVTGIVPRDRVEQVRTDYNRVQQEISAAQVRILELEAKGLEMEIRYGKERTQLSQSVSSIERQVRDIQARIRQYSRVEAPISGRITEFKVFEGAIVQTGNSIVSIAASEDATQAVVYIPTAYGKRVLNDMTVRVATSTVRKEEHGTILGRIEEVSAFPVTRQGMLAVLQNERLVAEYSRDGAPYAARVDLHADPASPSGFRWTSGRGPNVAISAGTTVEAEITVTEQAPVNLIIPFVRKHTGIGFWSGRSE